MKKKQRELRQAIKTTLELAKLRGWKIVEHSRGTRNCHEWFIDGWDVHHLDFVVYSIHGRPVPESLLWIDETKGGLRTLLRLLKDDNEYRTQ